MKKISLLVAAAISLILLSSCTNAVLPFSQVTKSINVLCEVDVGVQSSGGTRTLMDDSLVASLGLVVYNASGIQIGSGDLVKSTSSWKGSITINELGLSTFVATAYGATSNVLYSGTVRTTVSTSGESISITVSSGCSVVYNSNIILDSGFVPVDTSTYNNGTSVILPGNTGLMIKDQYIFCGWNTAADGSGTNYAVGDSLTMAGSGVTLYGVWISTNYLYISGTTVSSGWMSPVGNLIIPPGITRIEFGAFQFCQQLTSVTMPSSVTSIGDGAFRNCTQLTSVNIPSSVVSIESGAFSGCSNLSKIRIPSSVTNIGVNPFTGCTSMTDFVVEEANTHYSTISGVLFDKTVTNIIAYSKGGASAYTIPSSVVSIGENAFSSSTNLTSVTIPLGVIDIGTQAFESCTGLLSIVIPSSVITMGNSIFSNCTNLTEITLPDSLTSIGIDSFGGCSNLTTITLPSELTTLGDSTFRQCSSLTSINIPSKVTSIENNVFAGCLNLSSILIPNGLTSIGDYSFNGCSSLVSITIPATVNNIGSNAFNYCTSLIQILVDPSNLTYSSRSGALYDKSETTLMLAPPGLSTFIIPTGTTAIGNKAFQDCEKITHITIPEGVVTIGSYAFSNCTGLGNTSLPSTVTSIGASAFYFCSSMTSITIPDGITTIESSTFWACKALSTIMIPTSVTQIKEAAFQACYSLTSVEIPASVYSMGSDVFYGCKLLATVICNPVTPPTMPSGSSTFDSCAPGLQIKVASSAVLAYQGATGWGEYSGRIISQ